MVAVGNDVQPSQRFQSSLACQLRPRQPRRSQPCRPAAEFFRSLPSRSASVSPSSPVSLCCAPSLPCRSNCGWMKPITGPGRGRMLSSFLDHPPLIAWLIRFGTALFGDTNFGVRFAGLASMLAMQLLLAGIVWRVLRDYRYVIAVVLMTEAAPDYGLMMAKLAPDTALIPCELAMIWSLVRLTQSGDQRWWLPADCSAASHCRRNTPRSCWRRRSSPSFWCRRGACGSLPAPGCGSRSPSRCWRSRRAVLERRSRLGLVQIPARPAAADLWLVGPLCRRIFRPAVCAGRPVAVSDRHRRLGDAGNARLPQPRSGFDPAVDGGDRAFVVLHPSRPHKTRRRQLAAVRLADRLCLCRDQPETMARGRAAVAHGADRAPA